MKISVMIAAKNEEQMLAECLKSVSFADEIVIIDDFSIDKTTQIAKKFGAKIFKRRLDGFATQKNFGIKKAKNDWVLVLDADERISSGLRNEILNLEENNIIAYSISRKNYIKGKWIKHGGLYPDWQTRLFNRKFAHYGKQEVHETLDIVGKVGHLKHDIIHLTYKNYKEYLEKVNKYAKLEVDWAKKRPKRRSVLKTFFVKYVREKGFLDGFAGLVSAVLLAYYQYIIRREMGKK